MSGVFLTGGTGALGGGILEQLLAQPHRQVYLLVRADSDETARRRKNKLLNQIMGATGESHAERVMALRGDTRLPSFGLTPVQYQNVLTECDSIIHSAGLVRMNLPLQQAREAAVHAARNVIELARGLHKLERLRKVEFVSTVGVGGHLRRVEENWIEIPREFHNTYEQAKAEAELQVHTAISSGLPITVHRPSMVVGDSVTGRAFSFQVFYHLCEFLSGTRSRGLFPAFGNVKLDTIPVDYVAKAIAWSVGQAHTAGKVIHLCSGPHNAMRIDELQRLVASAFRDRGIGVPGRRILPRAMFRAMLWPLGIVAPEKIRRAVRTLPVFLDYLATEQVFHNEVSAALLAGAGVALPSPTEYLPKVIDYYLEHGRQPG